MKKFITISFFLLFLLFCFGAECPWGENGEAKHKRVAVKDRSIADSADAVKFTFSKFYKLKITNNQLTQINKNAELVLPNEKIIIKLTGYIRLLKEADDDCDIHIELAADKNPVANRIIAEVPNTDEYCELREEIFVELKERFNLDKKKLYRFDDAIVPKITVYGYVFFDSGHPTGHNHGSKFVQTVFEVHPIFQIDWE